MPRPRNVFHVVVLWLIIASCTALHADVNLDDLKLAQSAGSVANASLLWGTYRPNLYFGTRPRIPESLMTGLIWFDGSQVQGFNRARHACDQGDGIQGYGYQKHDGRNFASQKINDAVSNIAITTDFIKIPGGEHGGSWGVRIHGVPVNQYAPSVTSLVFYFGLEGEGSIDIVSPISKKGLRSPVKLEGDTPELGDFGIQIVDGPLNESPGEGIGQDLSRAQWWGIQVPEGKSWQAKDIIMSNLVQNARVRLASGGQEDVLTRPFAYFTLGNALVENEGEIANFYAFQKVYKGEFQFDVIFNSQSASAELSGEKLGTELSHQNDAFNARFEETFHLKEKGFTDSHITFAQYLLSNLLGGVGYFHGTSIVDRSKDPTDTEESFLSVPQNPKLEEAQSLYSATPSRPFFPRGFYWDEGYHQLVIGKWDNDLSLDIIKSWVSLIDENGWIAREQILGEEARSKVPPEFQTQFPSYGNPPTLYLAIKRYVDRLSRHTAMADYQGTWKMTSLYDSEILRSLHLDNPALARLWLQSIYPKLRLNWQWFRKTQRGGLAEFGRDPTNPEAYRWRGRTPNHTLTSGLDDYPRAEPPNAGELHADLLSWLTFATRLLKDIAGYLEHTDHVAEYTQVEKAMMENLNTLHWSEKEQAYCDQTFTDGSPVHVCHKGYLSLLPMVLGLLPPDAPQVGAILDLIENEKELWSPYGLRSLSLSDELYNTGEVYWRGPVWININYLTLQALYTKYMQVPGKYQEQSKRIYTALRKNIIDTVYKSYHTTGYVWEQYSPTNGEGMRSHPFTGWTSLVLLIMAEEY